MLTLLIALLVLGQERMAKLVDSLQEVDVPRMGKIPYLVDSLMLEVDVPSTLTMNSFIILVDSLQAEVDVPRLSYRLLINE